MAIKEINAKIEIGEYRYSNHAVKRMIKRAIGRIEIEEAVSAGEMIEEYPADKYSPSCLIYGRSHSGRPLHVQLSIPPLVVVVTVYEPDEDEWIDCRIRRKKI